MKSSKQHKKNSWRTEFKRIVEHPFFSFTLAGILLFGGIVELLESLNEEFSFRFLQGHHSMIIFGAGHMMKAINELVEAQEAIMVGDIEEDIETIKKNEE